MENKEVEILKIGSLLPVSPIKGTRVYDTSQFRKQTIMIVSNGGPIFDHYVNIIIKELSDDYVLLKTEKSIVGGPFSYRPGNNNGRLIGELDGPIVIGMSFAVENWHSSVVERVIDDTIVITKNSVYAIHDISNLRDKKLQYLGL
jgi:hypothetical protein